MSKFGFRCHFCLVDVANKDAGKVELCLSGCDGLDAGDRRRLRKLGPVDHHEEQGRADRGLVQRNELLVMST